MGLSFIITCLFLFVEQKVETGSVTNTSKTSWLVGSNVTLEWIYTDGSGQTVDYIEFGLADGIQRGLFVTVRSTEVVYSNPWPPKWTWYQGRVFWVGNLASKKASFRLIKAALNDSRKFYCAVTWSGAYETKTVFTTILITASPVVIKPIASSYYIEGNQVNVTCNTTGVPTPSVHWIRMIDDYKYQSFTGVSYLRFDSVNKEDAGQYKCIATNSAGTDEETVDIVVYYGPSITKPKESETTENVYRTGVNKLVCIADGNPPPTFTWEKVDGAVTGDVTTVNTSGGASSTLALQSVSESSTGVKYVCTATNSRGFAKATIELRFAGTDRPTTATTPGGGEPGAGKRSSDPALIGGAVGGSLALILIVVIIIIIIKCRKGRRGSRGYQGRGGYKERGTKSVSDIDDYEPVTKNNELPQYATVDRSKKTPKKSDLNYAELDHQNQSERSVDARPAKRNNEPTTYAEIVQTWEPTNERTYANVPRRGLNSSEML